MTKISDVAKIIQDKADLSLAYEWDNCGLNLGNYEEEVVGILFCVDISMAVLIEAKNLGCNLVISHHPVFFEASKKFIQGNFHSDLMFFAIKNNIALYCAHTNLDATKNGINEWLCNKLGFEIISGQDMCYRIAQPIKKNLLLRDLACVVESVLKDNHIKTIGKLENQCKKIAVASGSNGRDESFIETLKEQGVDTLITAEVKVSIARAMQYYGINLIEVGHYESEWCSKEIMMGWLEDIGIKLFSSKQEVSPYN